MSFEYDERAPTAVGPIGDDRASLVGLATCLADAFVYSSAYPAVVVAAQSRSC